MIFRKARHEELQELMKIYNRAVSYMKETGNPNQWNDGYPGEAQIISDIDNGYCHIALEDGNIEAVFALIPGDDPTYAVIEGQWLNEEPYAVVHRLAATGRIRGIGEKCLSWSLEKYPNLRVDTHADNKIMQTIIRRLGFSECGIIYTRNGTPRIAYQINKEDGKK